MHRILNWFISGLMMILGVFLCMMLFTDTDYVLNLSDSAVIHLDSAAFALSVSFLIAGMRVQNVGSGILTFIIDYCAVYFLALTVLSLLIMGDSKYYLPIALICNIVALSLTNLRRKINGRGKRNG